jgi:alpha-L-fucosidase
MDVGDLQARSDSDAKGGAVDFVKSACRGQRLLFGVYPNGARERERDGKKKKKEESRETHQTGQASL